LGVIDIRRQNPATGGRLRCSVACPYDCSELL